MTDADLLARFRDGDSAAFEELLSRYRKPLYAFVISLVRDEGAAGDIFQEVFLRVINRPGAYQERGNFKAWLFTVANNLCMDHLRKAGKADFSLDAEREDGSLPEYASQEKGPLQSLQAQETRAVVLEAVDSLSPEQKEVLFMREYSGMSFREIASATGVPIGTVLARMSRAVRKLRNYLEEGGHESV